jgi:hypothetical protein
MTSLLAFARLVRMPLRQHTGVLREGFNLHIRAKLSLVHGRFRCAPIEPVQLIDTGNTIAKLQSDCIGLNRL